MELTAADAHAFHSPHIRRDDVLAIQGKHDEADRLYVRTVNIQENELGLDHPKIAESLYQRAISLAAQVGHVYRGIPWWPNAAKTQRWHRLRSRCAGQLFHIGVAGAASEAQR